MRFIETANNVKHLALLTFLICLAVPGTTYAQLGGEADEEEEERDAVLEDFRFGVRVGAASSSLPNSDRQVSKRLGYAIGGFLTFDYPGPFALQPEILYLQEGATVRSVFPPGNAVVEAYLNFIELPVLLKYQFLRDSPLSLNALGGLAAGYSYSTPNGVALGATLGVEGGTAIGNSNVSLGLRFEPNLTAVSGASPTSKTRSFLVTASVSF